MASTGVGPAVAFLRGDISGSSSDWHPVWIAHNRSVGAQQTNGDTESLLGLQHRRDLKIAPPAEPTVIVDRGAPLVASRRRLDRGRPWALAAARHLDDQRSCHVARLVHEE